MIQSGLQQRSVDSCFTFAKIKVFTFKNNCKMTSIKARLNCSRLGKDGLYPLVIQVIHNRIKREIYTPYRLKRTEFDPHTERALTDWRSKTRATEIREINEYLIYIKEELEKVCHSLAGRGEFTSAGIIAGYKARNDMSNFLFMPIPESGSWSMPARMVRLPITAVPSMLSSILSEAVIYP